MTGCTKRSSPKSSYFLTMLGRQHNLCTSLPAALRVSLLFCQSTEFSSRISAFCVRHRRLLREIVASHLPQRPQKIAMGWEWGLGIPELLVGQRCFRLSSYRNRRSGRGCTGHRTVPGLAGLVVKEGAVRAHALDRDAAVEEVCPVD